MWGTAKVPTYVWACDAHEWLHVTTVADRDSPQSCPKCQAPGARQITLPSPVSPTAGDWNRQEFNPGLGCYTKSWKHARDIAKARGLEEVGNDDPNRIYESDTKAREARRAERWAEADREKLYD